MGRPSPNDGLATDLARPSPRAAPNVERALEVRVRYDAHAGVVSEVSPVRAELGERCVVLLTLC
jgi:hypothetical protein